MLVSLTALLFFAAPPVASKPLHALELPPKPGAFGLLKGLPWGKTEAQLQPQFGEALRRSGNASGPLLWTTRHDRLDGGATGFGVLFMAPQPKAAAHLAAAWGAPTVCTPHSSDFRDGLTNHLWFDEGAKVRAWLRFTGEGKGGLTAARYWPTADAVKLARDRPFIGQTLAQVAKGHPGQWDADKSQIQLPPPPWSIGTTNVQFRFDYDGRVRRVERFTFQLGYSLCREQRWSILEAFEGELGPAQLTVENGGWRYGFAEDPHIRLRPYYGLGGSHSWVVEVWAESLSSPRPAPTPGN